MEEVFLTLEGGIFMGNNKPTQPGSWGPNNVIVLKPHEHKGVSCKDCVHYLDGNGCTKLVYKDIGAREGYWKLCGFFMPNEYTLKNKTKRDEIINAKGKTYVHVTTDESHNEYSNVNESIYQDVAKSEQRCVTGIGRRIVYIKSNQKGLITGKKIRNGFSYIAILFDGDNDETLLSELACIKNNLLIDA